MKGEEGELRAGDKKWTRWLIESQWGRKVRTWVGGKGVWETKECVWEGDRVAKQIKRGGQTNGRLKEWQNERVKSDGNAYLVHPGWKLNHSLQASGFRQPCFVRVCKCFIRQRYRHRGIVPYAHIVLSCTSAHPNPHNSWSTFEGHVYTFWLVCDDNDW